MIKKRFSPILRYILLLGLIMPGYGKIVNVCDFGAVGDGATDNSEFFQKALDSLMDEGGIVGFPPAVKEKTKTKDQRVEQLNTLNFFLLFTISL